MCDHSECEGRRTTESCVECQREGFLPLEWCSPMCKSAILPLHRLLWHDLKTPIPKEQGAIPLLEVRKQENKQAVILLTPRGRQILCDMSQEEQGQIISIIGSARSGKSTRATLILQRLQRTKENNLISGFRSAPGTTKVVTLGLWIYPEPLLLENGSKCLLLDCEGMFRGRDSITSLLSRVAVGLSTCLLFCMKDGLTNTIIQQTSRMIDNLPLLTPATQKRKLVYWCTNLDQEWKQETGDIQAWFQNYLSEAPRLSTVFDPSFIITPPPQAKDNIQQELNDRKSNFGKAVWKEIDNVINQVKASPSWPEKKMVTFVESEVDLYTRNLSGVLPSLITKIHQQQTKNHSSSLLSEFKSKISWYTYALWKEDVPEDAMAKRSEALRTFQQRCTQEHLLLSVVKEALTTLDQACGMYQEEVVRTWRNKLAERQRQQEEKRREEIATELKKQEEAKKREEARLKEEQRRLDVERQRLDALRHAEFLRWTSSVEKERQIFDQHPVLQSMLGSCDIRTPDHPGGFTHTIRWGSGFGSLDGTTTRLGLTPHNGFYYITSWS